MLDGNLIAAVGGLVAIAVGVLGVLAKLARTFRKEWHFGTYLLTKSMSFSGPLSLGFIAGRYGTNVPVVAWADVLLYSCVVLWLLAALGRIINAYVEREVGDGSEANGA
jgi:hypothetical protein